ncbi:hypothetical protein BGZ76_008753 [Entomortierella beljakovae]|nr:hypothetical protein BGZ76_008753 [Entomortierella beljakovae]
MKTQFISLLFVASAALAHPINLNQMEPSSELTQRSFIGDEYSVQNQLDNSEGKRTFRIDHNGDNSVRKGLLNDIVDGDENQEGGFQFKRRGLLDSLFGGGSGTSINNVNDNSKNTQTLNQHGNKHIEITKIQKETGSEGGKRPFEMSPNEFFDRRDLGEVRTQEEENAATLSRRGLLFGGDSMSINNVDDNSRNTKTMNQHGNKDVSITKKITHQRGRGNRGNGGKSMEEGFFDKRELTNDKVDDESVMERRGLIEALFGGSGTTISNVNDNSQTRKTYNSHGNKDLRINSKVNKSKKRGLLFGGDSTNISNENYNGDEVKTYNSHGNVNKKISTKVEKGSGLADFSEKKVSF